MERITERKLKHKRFKNTEDSIIATLLSTKELLSPERLIRLAKISRSTLYRHHQNIHKIIPNYEQYILRKCRNVLRRSLRIKRTHTKTLFLHILIFISANKQVIKLLLLHGKQGIIEQIISVISPKIVATGKVKDGEMLSVYIKEISALIEAWGQTEFDMASVPALLDKIIYLTDTANSRLGPLAVFDQSRHDSMHSTSPSNPSNPSND